MRVVRQSRADLGLYKLSFLPLEAFVALHGNTWPCRNKSNIIQMFKIAISNEIVSVIHLFPHVSLFGCLSFSQPHHCLSHCCCFLSVHVFLSNWVFPILWLKALKVCRSSFLWLCLCCWSGNSCLPVLLQGGWSVFMCEGREEDRQRESENPKVWWGIVY